MRRISSGAAKNLTCVGQLEDVSMGSVFFRDCSPVTLNCVYLFPTPDVRLEEFVYEKLEKKVPTRLNNHEMLGQTMIDSGNEFGPGTAYGERTLMLE